MVAIFALAIIVFFVWENSRFASSYKDATYIIEGQTVTLKNGYSESEAAPGSASKIVTRYFGNEVSKDLNGDGREDVVFLLTQETGGSGTFYYVVAALNTPDGYVGSRGMYLGDRIAPQTTEISRNPNHVNVIVVNYADRASGEPMTARPSVGKSVWIKLDVESMQFGVVANDFEGEADPAKMTLGMKKWVWNRAFYNDGRVIEPKKTGAFTVAFKNDGTFSASTDCNGIGGRYEAKDGKLSFTEMAMTEMFCQDSQESVFVSLLNDSQTYHFSSRGELILGLKFDSGSVVFR